MDYGDLRELIWEARWDGVVMLAHALWAAVLANWWMGPLLVAVLVGSGAKGISRLVRYIGISYVRGSSSG